MAVFKDKGLLVVLLLFVILAAVYSVVNPLFEAPDEVWHYGYVHWIADGRGLSQPADSEGQGARQWAQEGSQPPLYYLAAGLLTAPLTGPLSGAPPGEWEADVRYNSHAAVGNADALGNRNYLLHGGWDDWPWRGIALGAHAARLFSILLGATTVVFAYLTARLLAPTQRAAHVPAAALVAFTPQFLFISASVSNDNMVTAVCAAGVWLSVALACGRVDVRGRTLAALGLLVGLAALSKLSGLLLGPFALLCLGIAAYKRGSSFQEGATKIGFRRDRAGPFLEGISFLRGGAIVVGVAALVAGWWYWRNWQLYGDPLGLSAMFAVGPARDEAAGSAELLALGPGVWRSAWAVFGWFNVTAPEWVYWFYTALTVVGLLGWGRIRRRGVDFLAAGLLALWSLAISAALVRWAQINYPQGRLLFPAISAAMPLLAVGLSAWWPAAWRKWVTLGVGAGMAGLAAAAPFLWIAPAYTPPPLLSPTAQPADTFRANIQLGEHIELVGWDMPDSFIQAEPGDVFDFTLYWRTDKPLPTDYSVFVHLVDELGIVQAQNDSHPALGGRPTSSWAPGAVVVDPHRLRLPTGLPPGRMTLEVGMYDYDTGERLPLTFVGKENGEQFAIEGFADRFALSSFEVPAQRSADGIPNPTAVSFGDRIELVGYDLHRRSVQPEGTLPVTLWWKATAPMDRDYVAFVHLVLPPDAVWAQLDRQPHAEPDNQLTPTSTWQVGQVIRDTYNVDIPAETPPGIYDVTIGWYDKDTFERLLVNFDDADVLIGRVRVEEK